MNPKILGTHTSLKMLTIDRPQASVKKTIAPHRPPHMVAIGRILDVAAGCVDAMRHPTHSRWSDQA